MPERQNRFNYTGRQRILREDIQLGLKLGSTGCDIEIQKLDLSNYSLYPSAEVLIETRIGRQGYHRVRLGTVEKYANSASVSLTDFEIDVAKFSIKILGTREDDQGKLLAIAEHLDLDSTDEIRSLLPFLPSEDLGQVLWRLEISEENGPEVHINYACGDWQGLARSTDFQSHVFTQVAKEILVWVALSSEVEEDANSKLGKWRRLFESFGANFSDIENNSDEIETGERMSALDNWAFGIVLHLANKERPLDRFLAIREES